MTGIESGLLTIEPFCGALPIDFKKMEWIKHNGVELSSNTEYKILTGWHNCPNCSDHWQLEFDYVEETYGYTINPAVLKVLQVLIPIDGTLEFEYDKHRVGGYFWFKDNVNEYYYAVDNQGVPNGIQIPFMDYPL